jgi:signal transduction histidine kinase
MWARGYQRKKYLDKLLLMTEQLEERYLIADLMREPKRADDQVFYRILKLAEKSMLEQVSNLRLERREYREYIEQWVHEVKTPITAARLLCENHPGEAARAVLAELEKVDRFTQQTLYYARSEHTEKDYVIREVRLSDVVHGAIADNKYLLRQNGVTIEMDDVTDTVYTDDKWVRFILNQLIGNAVKYRSENPRLRFSTREQDFQVQLVMEDNGIGIGKADLPRVFEKGFTGENGRSIQSATGIGLYLCRRLCDKLGIGLDLESDGGGTTVRLSFQVNHFLHFC